MTYGEEEEEEDEVVQHQEGPKSVSDSSEELLMDYDTTFLDFIPKDIDMFPDKAAIIQTWLMAGILQMIRWNSLVRRKSPGFELC